MFCQYPSWIEICIIRYYAVIIVSFNHEPIKESKGLLL